MSDAKVDQKNQSFWPTIKPFLTIKNQSNGNIMLCDNDETVTDSISVVNIFNEYFMEIADSIGFNDPIPSDFHSDHTLKAMIAKYDDHPSIGPWFQLIMKHSHTVTLEWMKAWI